MIRHVRWAQQMTHRIRRVHNSRNISRRGQDTAMTPQWICSHGLTRNIFLKFDKKGTGRKGYGKNVRSNICGPLVFFAYSPPMTSNSSVRCYEQMTCTNMNSEKVLLVNWKYIYHHTKASKQTTTSWELSIP